MNWRDWWLRVRALAAPRKVERELDEELAVHLEMETRKQLAAGLSPADARVRARARFGPASIADECRDARGIAFIDSCLRDIRYALRTFSRSPTVTATVVGTMGLGLYAAVFTIFNALVFRPEAVRDPDSLFSYSWSTRAWERHRFTLREYEALRRESVSARSLGAR